jgi:hypothetical protein
LNYFQPSIPFLGGIKVSPSSFQDCMVSNFTSQLKVRNCKHLIFLPQIGDFLWL